MRFGGGFDEVELVDPARPPIQLVVAGPVLGRQRFPVLRRGHDGFELPAVVEYGAVPITSAPSARHDKPITGSSSLASAARMSASTCCSMVGERPRWPEKAMRSVMVRWSPSAGRGRHHRRSNAWTVGSIGP